MSDLILVGVSGLDLVAACADETFKKNKISQRIMKKPDLKFNWKRFTFVIFACVTVIFVILRTPQNIDAKEILEFNRDLKNYNAKLQVFDSDNKEIIQFSIAIADSDEKKNVWLDEFRPFARRLWNAFSFL